MYRLLVVDDEERIRELIKKYALYEGYEVFEASNGMEAVEQCKKDSFDMIIMDIMMPDLDGFSAVREIRREHDTPVLMLSARGEVYDKIHGFELGADDYVVKPFSPKELMMRIEAILKRANKAVIQHRIYRKGGLTADFTARKIVLDGINIELSPKEYDLILYMIQNRNIALTRERLITEVWGYDYYGDDRTLDTHIKQLRKALGSYSNMITTLRGVGYRFDG